DEIQAMRRDLEGSLKATDYNFGRWSESGRLAAAAGAPEFLEALDTRRFPLGLKRRLGRDLSPPAGPAAEQIRTILDRGQLTAADSPRLEGAFSKIVETYYPKR